MVVVFRPRAITSTRVAGTAAAVVCLALLASCSPDPSGEAGSTSSPASGPASASATSQDPFGSNGSGIRPGSQDQTTLEFTPLIIDSLSRDVVPVAGSDGLYYLAYELTVLNDAPRDATMTGVETIAGDHTGTVIATIGQSQLAANTMLAAGGPAQSTDIPAGRTAIIVFRDTFTSKAAIPKTLTHRINATFAAPAADAPRLASKYPDQVAQIGGALRTSTESPIVIGPPLVGENWFANNGLDSRALNAHSDVVIPVGGRIDSAERYAIDFMGIDPTTMTSYHGDPSLNESYLAFDQPVLAVADAKVVRVVSDQPDVTPKALADLKIIDDATGNQVVLDLGDGVFALYAHLKAGSASVAVGDVVRAGQEIGRLGNSGNTSEAHLHFQLQRGPLLSSDNVPWVLTTFVSTGTLSPDGDSVVAPPRPGVRTGEVPVAESISTFPATQK